MSDPGLDAATQRVLDELRKHASDTVREGPVFTIRCLCGKRFGFSASYESHVAEAVARAAREDVADTVREAKAEALRDAAAEVFLLDCTGSTWVKDLPAGEQEWFHRHPMSSDLAYDEPRNVVAKWLDAEANRIEAER